MNNKASITALLSAFGRAWHTEHEENPIFSDHKAKTLLSDEEYKMMSTYVLSGIDFFAPEKKDIFKDDTETMRYLINTHIAPTPLCRSVYCETALKTAMRTGTEQYVILGAGFDTFAFREQEFVQRYMVYEIDHPKTQADKMERIARAGLDIPDNLIFVGVDFTQDNLGEMLLSAGFDETKKTFFSWLGVSYYLCREDIEKMLVNISSFAADGSTLLFDYADAGLFSSDEKRVQNMIAMAKAGGEEMKSSFDYWSMEQMLSDYGFLIYEFLEPNDIQTQIIGNRDMKAFEQINYVQAVIKKNG